MILINTFHKMKNIFKYICANSRKISFAFIALFFITFPMILTYDSAHYMGYVNILEKKVPFATWDIVRGPVFPILIFFSNFFFGKTSIGLVLLSLIFYLLMLFVSTKVLNVFSRGNQTSKYISYLLFILLVVFNIIIFGYFHTLLTEFVAISISVVSCYLSWLLLTKSFKNEKKSYLLISLYFVLITTFAWFLKQPYLSIALYPLVVSTIISIFKSKLIKSFIPQFTVILICVISLFFSIKLWNNVLEYKGIKMEGPRSASGLLSYYLINPLENYEIIKDTDEEYIRNGKFLSQEERKSIKEKDSGIRIVEVYNRRGELIDQMIIETNSDGTASTTNSLKFIVKASFIHPLETLESYTINYLGLINVYQPKTNNSHDYYVEKNFRLSGCYENCAIASIIGQTRNNIYYIPENMFYRVADYEQSLNSPYIFRFVLNKLKTVSIISFNVSFLLLPIALIIAILYMIFGLNRSDRKSKEHMSLVVILLGYSFLHLCTHTVTSAVIDRYASPAYITTILGYIGLLSIIIKSFNKNKFKRLRTND